MEQKLKQKISENRLQVTESLMKLQSNSIRLSKLEVKLDEANLKLNETILRLKVIEDVLATSSNITDDNSSQSQGLEAHKQQLLMDALEELRQQVKTETKEALNTINNRGLGASTNQALDEIKTNIKKLSLMSKLAGKGNTITQICRSFSLAKNTFRYNNL